MRRYRWRICCCTAGLLALAALPPPAAAAPSFAAGITTGTTASPLVETSGAAASETNAHVLWVHNDSGDAARIFAISDTGQRLGNYLLTSATHQDYEDIAIGPGPVPGISYIYVGDIGDNGESRGTITVYRIPEPAVYTRRAAAPIVVNIASGTWQAITLDYGVSAHNAETLMVDPRNGDLLVGTKEDDQCRIYRATQAQIAGGGTVMLALVATISFDVASSGAISPTGDEIIIRQETFAKLWTRGPAQTFASAMAGTPVSLPIAAEPNGEAVTFDRIGHGYFTLTEGNPAPVHYYARTSADGPLPRVDIVAAESAWKYLDNGTDQGTAWRMPGFDDAVWPSGPAQLGYGEGDELTTISFGADAQAKHPTTYFRKEFQVDAGVDFDSLRLQVLYPSGVALFLNGNEILRDRLASDASSGTLATAPRGVLKQAWYSVSIDPAALAVGTNTLAAEVHLDAANQADLSFDLQLIGAARQHALTLTENDPAQGQAGAAPAPNAGSLYLHGTTLTLSATPEPGYILQEWRIFDPEVGGSFTTSASNPLVLSIQANQHVEAVWASAPPEGEGGSEGEGITEGAADGEGALEGTPEGNSEGETAPCPSQSCLLDCVFGPATTHFESSLANVYASFGIVGFPPATTDLDGNGIIDAAQARLVDSVLANAGGSNNCCLMGAYLNNAAAAAALADSVYGDDASIGPLSRNDYEAILAGVATQGEKACIDSVTDLLENYAPIPDIDLSGFDFSIARWLASYGDQDIDQVCNLGEYHAAADFNAFVAAAQDGLSDTDGGGCAPCAEGEGGAEGGQEGVAEGNPEGIAEGNVEGLLEGMPEGEGFPEGTPEGEGSAEGEGFSEGVQEGSIEGIPEGAPEGEGIAEGISEGLIEGGLEGLPEGEGGNEGEGLTEGEGEGTPDGEADGEGITDGEGGAEAEGEGEAVTQTADQNGDGYIGLAEVLRVIQFYNALALHCDGTTEDGYAPGPGDTPCPHFDTDYRPADWSISLSELLRLVQFYNSLGYHACPAAEDGFCVGSA